MTRHRIAVIGLGMAVTPHAKSLLDLRDRVEVAYAFSRSEARRQAFARALRLSHDRRSRPDRQATRRSMR